MRPSTNDATAGVMIIPDADEFLRVMAALQDEYNKKYGHTGEDVDEG